MPVTREDFHRRSRPPRNSVDRRVGRDPGGPGDRGGVWEDGWHLVGTDDMCVRPWER